jgi:hypothetical protein
MAEAGVDIGRTDGDPDGAGVGLLPVAISPAEKSLIKCSIHDG